MSVFVRFFDYMKYNFDNINTLPRFAFYVFASIAVNMLSSKSCWKAATGTNNSLDTALLSFTMKKTHIRPTLGFPLAIKHKNIMEGKEASLYFFYIIDLWAVLMTTLCQRVNDETVKKENKYLIKRWVSLGKSTSGKTIWGEAREEKFLLRLV